MDKPKQKVIAKVSRMIKREGYGMNTSVQKSNAYDNFKYDQQNREGIGWLVTVEYACQDEHRQNWFIIAFK
jgi:hypothetical protein